MVTIVAAPTTGKYEATDRLFTCPIHWVVTGATSGFIVQHIQRNEKYKAGEEDVISALDYWEAWHIELDGSATPISHGINDNFGVYVEHTCLDRNRKQVFFPSKKDTKGKWKIRGTVYYVPEASFVVQQWFRDKDPATGQSLNEQGSVAAAGKLLSRWDTPTPGQGLATTYTLGRPVCTRQFAGSWDLTGSRRISASRRWPLGGNFDSEATYH